MVVESWLLICARLGRDSAMRIWDAMAGGVATVVGVTAGDLTQAREIAGRWTDQTFSLVDCTSFALLDRLGIHRALAFDRRWSLERADGAVRGREWGRRRLFFPENRLGTRLRLTFRPSGR